MLWILILSGTLFLFIVVFAIIKELISSYYNKKTGTKISLI